ncbi:MAG: molybdate ABC transporter substrate-binding protein [Anaerolineaceae bacterium]
MKSTRNIFNNGIIIFTLLLTSGCSAAVTEPTVSAQPEAAGETSELVVFAAASLTESFSDIASLFEEQHAGVKVQINFASSSQLAQQLANGAAADVYASANEKQMQVAVDSGRISADQVAEFVNNKLTLAFPKDNPANISSLEDLAKPGIKLVICAKEVPVGNYALQYLALASTPEFYGTDYQDKVLANVVSYETDVKAAVAKVALGEADAGIVYASDLMGTQAEQIGQLAIPTELNPRAVYVIAPVNDSHNSQLANDFVQFVLSDAAQNVFANCGFQPVQAK